MSEFTRRVKQAVNKNQSLLCIGLDPNGMFPAHIAEFNKNIVQATSKYACAYKPNLAFYEQYGQTGMDALWETVRFIRHQSPDALIIGDGKRGDVENSAYAYRRAMFEVEGFDATTVNPLGGSDSVEPFLIDPRKGVFVWCMGSNKGAFEFQDLIYEKIAESCNRWNENGNVGLVVGATVPDHLSRVREICPTMPILVPGVGLQGGYLSESVRASVKGGNGLALFNLSSRSILHESRAQNENVAHTATRLARTMRDAISAEAGMVK